MIEYMEENLTHHNQTLDMLDITNLRDCPVEVGIPLFDLASSILNFH